MLKISHKTHDIMEGVTKVYGMKRDPETKNTYGDTRRYPGTNVGKFDLPSVSGTACFISVENYIKEAVKKFPPS